MLDCGGKLNLMFVFWSAQNGHVSIGTPVHMDSSVEFQPQCDKKALVDWCDRICNWGAQPLISMPRPLVRSSNPALCPSQCCQLTQNHPDYIIFHVEPSRKSIPHVWDLSNWQESFRCFVCLYICTSRVFSRRKPWRLWIVFQLVLFWLLLLVEYDCHREQRIFPTWRCL